MDKNKAGYTEGILSIIVNSLLFVLKMWAGIVTGSIALTADAWHTMSDSLSSVVVLAAVRLSSKKPDKEHPFGHGRWEPIAAMVIAFILIVIAFGFLKDSITQFYNRETTANFGIIAIVVTVISIVVKEAVAQYAFYVGRKTDNASVKADGWHHRTDALSSVVVLIGILFAKNFWWIDSVLGFIISLMLFYVGYKIIKDAAIKLLGEEPGPELIAGIKEKAKELYTDDLQLHHFHIHNYISHKELTLHIKLDKNLSIEAGHKVASDIEDSIQESYGIIATVHVEPLEKELSILT